MKIEFGKPYRRGPDRKLGARARIIAEHGAFQAPYEFDTHGLDEEATAAKVRQIKAHHRDRSERLTGFLAIRGQEFVVASDTYRIVDCTIFDRGRPGGRVELYADVRLVRDGQLIAVTGFPIKRRYTGIEQVPPDAEIVQMIEAQLPVPEDTKAKHENFVKEVRRKLNGGE